MDIGAGLSRLKGLSVEEILNNIIGFLLLIGAGWFAWETTLMVDEMKNKRRRK